VNASWYDVLDVDATATEDEIRAAWRSAVADLDPTDRRFRVYNQAAEVLLDPRKRVAYDAELAAAEGEPDDDPVADPAAAPAAEAVTERAAESSTRPRWWPLRRRSAVEPPDAEEALARPDQAREPSGRHLPVVPGWLLVAAATVTACVLVIVGVLLTQPSDASVESDTQAAQAAAESAIVPILSYDAHHLAQSRAQATPYMTEAERQEYDKLFAVIQQNAPRTGTVVQAKYVASGIVRSGPDQVDVLVFVDQKTFNNQHPHVPVVYKNQVTVSMEKVGNDWLVDHLTTNTG
jgi:Mce-associated membrane protein